MNPQAQFLERSVAERAVGSASRAGAFAIPFVAGTTKPLWLCYNASKMPRSFGRPRFGKLLVKTVVVSLMAAAVCAAQQPAPATKPATAANSAAGPQKIYVVLPFEGTGAPAKLDWLSEGLEELTIE